ncbi:hypothetical protein LOAG_01422 [Loa loa]|uniref:Uncharacterized protein n=1 Tax=Loa loa TaxID=7209 RepID=A0A1S0U9F4_LOALO|nr:hypothetical protein LOAG_01422 [Loa loa]EFO27067.2 hypothetical protein LOAG_01422 [Loa loa]
MAGDQKITTTASNENYTENQQKLKCNDRKRKQITNISSRQNRNSKIRALSDNADEVIAMEYDTSLSALQKLPMILLSQIASNLNIREQKNSLILATKLYWDTRTDLHIGDLMRQTFPFINQKNRYSLHAIRRELSLMLRLIPNFALRKLHFQPIYLLHLQDLQDIEIRTKKSAKQIYGAVKHLDLRGCSVEYGELLYFSNACTKLSSIAITHAAVFLPNELFIDDDCTKQNKSEQRPFGRIRDFLRISLPNFTEMEKKGELPVAHIELLVKLLMLFPYLETFYID